MAVPQRLRGQVVDVVGRRIFPAEVQIEAGRIADIRELAVAPRRYIMPGLVDAHVHIESSLLPPSEFARLALVHGTVATVSDPHEIANVAGLEGVRWMLDDADRVPLKFSFGVPSCVPSGAFETAGARLDAQQVAGLLQDPRLSHLAEVMDYAGVIDGQEGLHKKIAAARAQGRPIDGHAPGLRGEALKAYVAAGIGTDHECSTLAEAEEKIAAGMKIIVRQGSAARDYEALAPLLGSHPDRVMFCSDDRHPDDLLGGHMDTLVRRALAEGYGLFDVLRAATLNPVRHYGLQVGLLQVGDPADLMEVDDFDSMLIRRVFIEGQLAYDHGRITFQRKPPPPINHFVATPPELEDLRLQATGNEARVMQVRDGQLQTPQVRRRVHVHEGHVAPEPLRDLLKLVVVPRYAPGPVQVGLVEGFGLRRGALASSVAHDAHNIVAVGADDDSLVAALRAVIEAKGGLAVSADGVTDLLALPLAGLMSTLEGAECALRYQSLEQRAQILGSKLQAPLMALSFVALPVIPELKLTDKGLVHSEFGPVPLFFD